MKELKILLSNEKNTLDLGENLSAHLFEGLLIFLKGDVGGRDTIISNFIFLIFVWKEYNGRYH